SLATFPARSTRRSSGSSPTSVAGVGRCPVSSRFATLARPEKGGGPNVESQSLRDPGGDRPLGRQAGPLGGIQPGTPRDGRRTWSPRLPHPLSRSSSHGYTAGGASRRAPRAFHRTGSGGLGQVLEPGRRDRGAGDGDEDLRARGARGTA